MNTTRDGVEVKRDQIWRDLDKRMPDRYCKVEDVLDGKAIMNRCTKEGRIINSIRNTKISISRMYHHSTGWELVKND